MKKKLIPILFFIGFSGFIAQILFLREFLIIFLGNELSIGIILSNWLLLGALGAFLGGRLSELFRRKIECFIIFSVIFAVFLPVSIYFIRLLKDIFGILQGQGVGLGTIFYSSLLIIFPINTSCGILFIIGTRIYSQYSGNEKISAAGSVYVLDTLGALVAGLIFTYLLVPFFHSFEICLGLSLVNLILGLILLRSIPFRGLLYKSLSIFILAFIGLFSILLLRYSDIIHEYSASRMWPGQRMVFYKNSIYGNVAVTSDKEQKNFYSNGIPIFTYPDPDIVEKEEFAHFALLSHPDPEEVLVISGGVGGLIKEIVKYGSVKNIDYAEIDPLLIKAARKYAAGYSKYELDNPKVNLKFIDGRLFLKDIRKKYDLIFIGIELPSDLQNNRLFTKEFFKLVSRRLEEKGILAMKLPGSATYMSPELRKLNLCILETLEESYRYIRVIPSDSNIYMASDDAGLKRIDAELLTDKLNRASIDSRILIPEYFKFRLAPERIRWFRNSLKGLDVKVNRDFQPAGLLYTLSYWRAMFSPDAPVFFSELEQLDFKKIIWGVLVVTVLLITLGLWFKRAHYVILPYSIITTGFSGMIFNLGLVFAFQIIYGYVFYWIGILLSVFMFGAAMGSLIYTGLLSKIRQGLKNFAILESVIACFALVMPFILIGCDNLLGSAAGYVIYKAIFLFFAFTGGFLIGAEFPLANKLYSSKFKSNLGATAGGVYSSDLAGGWLGGILGGVVLLPGLGLKNTFLLVVILKLSSLIVLATLRGRD